MSALLEVRGLKKHFPVLAGLMRRQVATVKAVDGIHFSIQEGQTLGIVGESGCGKSTAALSAIRLLEPTAGELLYRGQDLVGLDQASMVQVRRDIQVVFQDPMLSLNPRKTIGEALCEPLRYHGILSDEQALHRRSCELLEMVGLPPAVVNRYPHEFSGGQLQRICIGRAMALEPKLVICDEAVSALDISVQGQILNLLVDLQKRLGLSYLFISHDLSVVRHLCDHVLVMYLGKVMESAPAESLFKDPAHPYTQALLSALPKAHPKAPSTRIPLQGEVPSPLNPPSGCPFRTRCPYVEDRCAQSPPVQHLSGHHLYHCILQERPGA